MGGDKGGETVHGIRAVLWAAELRRHWSAAGGIRTRVLLV